MIPSIHSIGALTGSDWQDLVGLLTQTIVGLAAIGIFQAALRSVTFIGTVMGKMNDRSKGLIDRSRQFGQNTGLYQRRQLAKENRERERKRAGAESYARLMNPDDRAGWLTRKRSAQLRRRAGGYLNQAGQQRAYADTYGVVEKQFKEDKERARSMMSIGAARAFGNAGSNQADIDRMVAAANGNGVYEAYEKNADGSYRLDASGNRIKSKDITFSTQDREAIRNLHQAGFLRADNNRAGAAAALDELFDQNFVEKSDIQNLARVAGERQSDGSVEVSRESAGLMTKTVADAAAKNKYKNFTYGEIHEGNGSYTQYIPAAGSKDAISIVESGVQGVPKETFEDASILAGIAHKTRGIDPRTGAVSADQRMSSIIDVARQTMTVDKAGIIRDIAQAVGVDENEFIKLRQAIQTNSLTEDVKTEVKANAMLPNNADVVTRFHSPGNERVKNKIIDAYHETLGKRAASREYVPVGDPERATNPDVARNSAPLDYINNL